MLGAAKRKLKKRSSRKSEKKDKLIFQPGLKHKKMGRMVHRRK
jgi:hypothetical protein